MKWHCTLIGWYCMFFELSYLCLCWFFHTYAYVGSCGIQNSNQKWQRPSKSIWYWSNNVHFYNDQGRHNRFLAGTAGIVADDAVQSFNSSKEKKYAKLLVFPECWKLSLLSWQPFFSRQNEISRTLRKLSMPILD